MELKTLQDTKDSWQKSEKQYAKVPLIFQFLLLYHHSPEKTITTTTADCTTTANLSSQQS